MAVITKPVITNATGLKIVDAILKLGGGGDDGKWKRPAGMPDTEALLAKDDEPAVLYLTYDVTGKWGRPWHGVRYSPTALFEVGYVENGEFMVVSSDTVTYPVLFTGFFDDMPTDYAVVRIVPSSNGAVMLQPLTTSVSGYAVQLDSETQPLLEIVGRFPGTRYRLSGGYYLLHESVEYDSLTEFFANTMTSLECIDTSKITSKAISVGSSIFNASYRLRDINLEFLRGSSVSLSGAFNASGIEYLYIPQLSGEVAATGLCTNCFGLKSADVSELKFTASTASMFTGCNNLVDLKMTPPANNFSLNFPKLSVESMTYIFEHIPALTQTKTVTVGKNIVKLSTEQIAAATQKGWTVA